MLKITTLAVVAGLVSLTSIAPSYAQARANIPGGPSNYPTEEPAEEEEDCEAEMGFSPPISAAAVDGINDQYVRLYPVCETDTITHPDDHGTLFLDGNANTLRNPIARNATLMSVLAEDGYDQHDVISVVFGANDSVLLYVHQREVR